QGQPRPRDVPRRQVGGVTLPMGPQPDDSDSHRVHALIIAEIRRRFGCYTAAVARYWVGIEQASTATKACLMDRRGGLRRLGSTRAPGRVSARTPPAEESAG